MACECGGSSSKGLSLPKLPVIRLRKVLFLPSFTIGGSTIKRPTFSITHPVPKVKPQSLSDGTIRVTSF